jgi:hypothetical protein
MVKILIVVCLFIVACEKSPKAGEGILENSEKNIDTLIKGFLNDLKNQQAKTAYSKVVLYKEHIEIDSLEVGSPKDERTIKLMARMHYDNNVKHLRRWEEKLLDSTLVYQGYVKSDSLEQMGPYVIHTGFKLKFKDGNNNFVLFKPFNSVIEQRGGFKIWNVLDTHSYTSWDKKKEK